MIIIIIIYSSYFVIVAQYYVAAALSTTHARTHACHNIADMQTGIHWFIPLITGCNGGFQVRTDSNHIMGHTSFR